MRIGTVVEGPTDRLLIKAIINKLYPVEHEYLDLQPADVGESFGERGTGWKGVRRFCFDVWQQLNANVANFIIDYQLDLLVIHIDADVANDFQEGTALPVKNILQPCPPIALTITNLREVIAKWLNFDRASQLPPPVVLTIPAQDSENWIFAALFPDEELCQNHDYECIHPLNSQQHPAYLLTLSKYGSVLRRQQGKIKKSKRKYLAILPDVTNSWDRVCAICTQAQSFNDDLANRP